MIARFPTQWYHQTLRGFVEKSSSTLSILAQDIKTGEDPKKGNKEDIHTESAKAELIVLKGLHQRLLETKDPQEKKDLRKLIMEKVEKIERLLHKNKPKEGENLVPNDKIENESNNGSKKESNAGSNNETMDDQRFQTKLKSGSTSELKTEIDLKNDENESDHEQQGTDYFDGAENKEIILDPTVPETGDNEGKD